MYKCAFLGCGPRARRHADAYAYVKRGQIAAICDLDEARLNDFGDKYGVSARYTDLHEMFEKEKPDLVHVVTIPGLRVELMTAVAEHKVPHAIVEKPIALWGEDWRQLKALSETCETKFAVNTQLHFHPDNLMLKQDVAEGKIGEVRGLDASARSTPLDQGVHVLELAHSYNGFAEMKTVFGQISGVKNIDSRQPSPDMAAGSIVFQNNVHLVLVCGLCAPRATDSDKLYHHKRLSVYGTRGFIQWTMDGWERSTVDGGHERGSHNYLEQDDLGQAALTEACFDWLEDENKPHPTRLERSLTQFNALLGLYVSGLQHRPVELPCDPPDGLCEAVRAQLS